MKILSLFLVCLTLASCVPFRTGPIAGPDKQAVGTLTGAAIGAGSGAVWGAQVSAGTGPGALIGAGFGAFYGAIHGLGVDLLEENQLARENQKRYLEELTWAQDILSEHYRRRLELHPSRDIFPADWFFDGDATDISPKAKILVREIARMTRKRMPWSRIVVASYVTTNDLKSPYAHHLNEKRAFKIARSFVNYGVSGRRVFTKSITMPDPVLIDPDDDPFRYRQAIEIIPLDY